MRKKQTGVLLLVIIGAFVAIFIIWIGVMSFNFLFLLAGASTLILSLFIFFLKNWARITAIVLSVAMLMINILLMVAARYVDPFFGISLVFFSPLTLISIICFVYLTRPRVKAFFD